MELPVLVIGNKNYSSWSLRPWLLLRHDKLREWMEAGRVEEEIITKHEVGFLLGEPGWEQAAGPDKRTPS